MLTVAAFYKFFRVDDREALKAALIDLLDRNDIFGTILLAHEGINGTVCGARESIDNVKTFFANDARFDHIEYKESFTATQPFVRRHVKIKDEIVTMGQSDLNPHDNKNTRYVDAREWDKLLADPEVLVIDVRNKYETKIGSFSGALDPKLDSFNQFPDFVDKELNPARHKRIAMSCTGGIRCEKASAYLSQQGFAEIYQLKGGVLRYLEDTDKNKTSWQGECFVFDHRVSVDHDLKPGSYTMCFNCRAPLSDDDKKSDAYKEGVVCAECAPHTSAQKQASKHMRDTQIRLAKTRSQTHLGTRATA